MSLRAVGVNPTRVVTAGDGPGVLANRDINNQVLIGTDISITGQNINSYSILDPLVGLPVSGQKDIYACCLPGVTSVFIDWLEGMDIQDWQPSPGAAAQQISNLGIPPVDNPTAVFITFNQLINPTATYTTPRMTFKQFQSYSGTTFCTFATATSNVNPFCQYEWQHSVASDNYDPLRQEDWFVPSTPFNFTYNYRNDIAGFIIGDTITLSVTNLDTVQAVNFTLGIFGSYRTRLRTQMRGRYFQNSPNPQFGLGSDDVVGYQSFVALANNTATAQQLMNLFEGDVSISGQMSAGGGAGSGTYVLIQPQPAGFANNVIAIPVPANGLLAPVTVTLPRRVCTISVNNGSGGAITGAVIVTAAVQPE